jgi:hypothetical protein
MTYLLPLSLLSKNSENLLILNEWQSLNSINVKPPAIDKAKNPKKRVDTTITKVFAIVQ